MGEIREGQKTKLMFKTADGSEKEFDCFIKEVFQDRLSLSFSRDLLDYACYFEEGTELPVKIFTPTGVKAFDTIIINSPYESDFVIEFVEDHIQIQRREFTRVELKIKVIIERTERDNVVTETIDISGGGIRFLYDGEFDFQEEVGALLYLPYAIRSIKAKGYIIKPEHLPVNQHVLLFTSIDENDRDKIVKQCFDVQLSKDNS